MEIQERGSVELMNSIINEVEKRILRLEQHQIRGFGEEMEMFPTFHHFSPGLYCREMHIPKGGILTSYVHKTEHPFMVLKGEGMILNEECKWVRITAPFFGITKAGTRRMGFHPEDTVWITVHTNPNDERDIEKIEREIFEVPEGSIFEGVIT